MLTKKQAIDELEKYDHAFLTPEAVRKLGEPFGVYETITATDNRSDFKGLNLGPDNKEGDTAEGLAAHDLARLICRKENVPYAFMHEIGSQLRVCCEALLKRMALPTQEEITKAAWGEATADDLPRAMTD